MLDIKFIRDNAEVVKGAAKNKLVNIDIDKLLNLDDKVRKATALVEELRAERNALSKEISSPSCSDRNMIIRKVKEIKEQLSIFESRLISDKNELKNMMLMVPSIPAPEVPVGRGEEDNVEIRKWGDIPRFDFAPKDHLNLAESLDLVDIQRAVKFAGSRTYFLKNEGMLLEIGICKFVIDKLVANGFTPMSVPLMVRNEAMQGTGYFPIGYEQAYKLQEDELFLIGTSEVSMVSYHQDEVLDLRTLPKKYAGLSSCFRREAGTYGKDTRGLYRVHQFQKVEQVVICENDDLKAKELHYEILQNAEEILKELELPHRVMLACTGEIGLGQVLKHEVEAWMPSRSNYCETHSCSTMKDFQARRSNIRYKDIDGKLKYVYTLNNTAIASPRILIPLLEIHQKEDGSVTIPKALKRYMGGLEKIVPKGV